ncbi:MAG: tetraacyldisaccharide 4'-kinase [Pseudomonadales bacterium]
MLQRQWYQASPGWARLLSPLEWLYKRLAAAKRERDTALQWQSPVPLVVVGNIAVGGTGKSPLTVALIELLRRRGYHPGVVSRGYGAKGVDYPAFVTGDGEPLQCGDEPLMVVRRTEVPMVIDPDRSAACRHLLAHSNCDVIISDDGLQHYRMGRDLEIAVIDGARGLGNERHLPVGPLREGAERLQHVDYCVVNGASEQRYGCDVAMQLKPAYWCRVRDGKRYSLSEFLPRLGEEGRKVQAFAGIGNPQRFFDTLHELGVQAQSHAFADHYRFSAQDLAPFADDIVLMTEKDAVKCGAFATPHCYYLAVEASLSGEFEQGFCQRIDQLTQKKRESLDGQKVT